MRISLIIFFFLELSAAIGQDVNEIILQIKDFEDCKSNRDSIYGNEIYVEKFEKIVLGIPLKDVRQKNAFELDNYFNFLYSRNNVTEKYQHPNGEIKIYPIEPICPLYDSYIEKQSWKERDIKIYELMFDEIVRSEFSIELFYDCSLKNSRKEIKIIEENEDEAYFVFKDKKLINEKGKEGNIISREIPNWKNLKENIIKLGIDEIGNYNDQYDIKKLYTDGCGFLMRVQYQGQISFFTYVDLEDRDNIKPADFLKKLLKLINEFLDISIKK